MNTIENPNAVKVEVVVVVVVGAGVVVVLGFLVRSTKYNMGATAAMSRL